MNKYYPIVSGVLLLVYGLLMLFSVIEGSLVYAIIAVVLGVWGILAKCKKCGQKNVSSPPPPPAQ